MKRTKLTRYLIASITGLQLLVGVLAGGSVIGAFLVPSGPSAAAVDHGVRSYTEAELSAGAPMKLLMPALKIDAPVVPIAMVNKSLDPPRDYLEVGWWNASAKPGAAQGQTVITGHTLHTGGASMNNLGELQRGNKVDVVTKRGTIRYAVTSKVVYSKKELSQHSKELFAQDRGDGRLVLITCSDWNGSYYETNTVVFAKLKA
ncbi:class F sortase [Nocardioides sp. Kera G14]|uniref:class F sortase n=1 Tax=Nocardioides sp. Kera G14 TaxID=2884264 RepID=UPI001D118529|nr:class F sortase [Nocardioides sp. Kera G14]UDY24435.1 class F sortase [Nocardioides sp. Kera G14]